MSHDSGSTLLDDQDEDVRIAVRALGDMRNGTGTGIRGRRLSATSSPTPALSISASSIPTTSVPSPTLSSISGPSALTTTSNEAQVEPDFVSRMSHIPLVNNALRMYEQGKASSRVVKYGAEIMESGVKTISRPVIERLPTGQLDDFACRQLDRLDKYRRPSHSSPDDQDRDLIKRTALPLSPVGNQGSGREEFKNDDDVGRWVQLTQGSPSRTTNLHSSRSSTPTQYSLDRDISGGHPTTGPSEDPSTYPYTGYSHNQQRLSSSQQQHDSQQQVAQRSRWHAFLGEAGGLSAAWSEESMRRLKYVLQCLQYATNHIDEQILTIREFTESLQQHYFDPTTTDDSPTTPTNKNTAGPRNSRGHSRTSSARGGHSRSSSESQSQAISSDHMLKLTSLRRDVVHTVREVVGVVSKYGGGSALPEPARNAMKGFILKLPKQVGEAMRIGPTPPSDINAGMGSANIIGSGSNGVERDSVTAAASGRPGSDRRTAASRKRAGDRGVGGGSLSATASPVPSRTTSPAASPRIHTRMMYEEDHSASGSRHVPPPHTMSAGTAVLAAQRILTLATESLDMMRGVTGVVKASLDKADVWIERFKIVGVQRSDGSSDVEVGTQPAASDQPHSPSPSSISEGDRRRSDLHLPQNVMQYRDLESDPALLSPLSLGRSRRGSFGSSQSYSRSGSLPSTPDLGGLPQNYPLPYSTSYGTSNLNRSPQIPVDAPSPEVGSGLRRMNIHGGEEDEQVDIKREDHEETKMEIDG